MLSTSIVLISVFVIVGQILLNFTENQLFKAFDRSLKSRAEFLISRVDVSPYVILPPITADEKMLINYQYFDTTNQIFKSADFPDSNSGTFNNYRFITVFQNDDDNEQTQIQLTLALPIKQLQSDLDHIKNIFLICFLCSLMLVFVAVYFVSTWFLKPIRNITNKASKIVSTDTIEELPLPNNKDELFVLTNTINNMLIRIKENGQLQKNFFASAAHELRTPLAVMKTGIEVNISNPKLSEETKSYFEEYLQEINRISRLLEDFLLISRSETGNIPVLIQEINFTQLIYETIEKLKSFCDEYEIKIEIHLNENQDIIVNSDLRKLEHVLLNLMENAIKYAKTSTAVKVYINQNQNEWICEIENITDKHTGETQSLLEAFYRGNPLKEGHGLGLWISNQLAKIVGSTISISWSEFVFKATLKMPK
ncbi:MAG: HAMP domain-containing sensor histidine kinase [Bacteroidota bacterium]|nr:HAMP domain-containing sensor histidine kinase [Bacteroidota bacterium]